MGSARRCNSTRADRARSRLPSYQSLFLGVLGERIERQRGHLYQASALLRCLRIAAIDSDDPKEVDVASIAKVARCLIDKASNYLDSVLLNRAPIKGGIQ